MKQFESLVVVFTAFVLLSGPAQANDEEQGKNHGRPDSETIFKQIDADTDGSISIEEFRGAHDRMRKLHRRIDGLGHGRPQFQGRPYHGESHHIHHYHTHHYYYGHDAHGDCPHCPHGHSRLDHRHHDSTGSWHDKEGPRCHHNSCGKGNCYKDKEKCCGSEKCKKVCDSKECKKCEQGEKCANCKKNKCCKDKSECCEADDDCSKKGGECEKGKCCKKSQCPLDGKECPASNRDVVQSAEIEKDAEK
jgi:hypothetical protein